MKSGYVYILASERNGTLYIGVTSDLARRVYQHKNKVNEGFTSKYGVNKLVYYEIHDGIGVAIAREKALKFWKRKWKLQLIEDFNPEWRDRYEDFFG